MMLQCFPVTNFKTGFEAVLHNALWHCAFPTICPPAPLVPGRRVYQTLPIFRDSSPPSQPPYKPTVGRLSFRVQLSRDGWHFATVAVTAQLHHTLEGLQPNTRYAATVLATIEDAGTVLWDGVPSTGGGLDVHCSIMTHILLFGYLKLGIERP